MKISIITATYNSGATLRDTLESILRQSTVDARTYIRAKILLLKSESNFNAYIADISPD